MSRILAFGDSFVVGDQDDYGPNDVNYNPKIPTTHSMGPNEREQYLKYNVSFAALIAKQLGKELLNFAVRGTSNFSQIDQLLLFIGNGKLQQDDLILFGISTTVRDRSIIYPSTDLEWDKFSVLDLVYILSTLDSISKKYSVPIIKFNLFDNPLVGQSFNFDFDFAYDNYIGWDVKANTLSDVINDTWAMPINERHPYHTHMMVKPDYEQYWTWNRHPSIEGHKKLADWFLKQVPAIKDIKNTLP